MSSRASSKAAPWSMACCGLLILAPIVVVAVGFFVLSRPEVPKCESVAAARGDLFLARRGFVTRFSMVSYNEPLTEAPEGFRRVQYRSGNLELSAYVNEFEPGVDPVPGIIWLSGGMSNSVGLTPWVPSTPENDQSASAFWEAGMAVMYPVLRGGEGSDVFREGFFGEVDDVIAAAEMFRELPHVDSERLYLAGHSTGGTLALLVAAARSDLFAGVYSYGPVADVGSYGSPWDELDICERELRSPKWFLSSINAPTEITEGEFGNEDELMVFFRNKSDAPISVFEKEGADHFSHLRATTTKLARELLIDAGLEPVEPIVQ